MVLSKQCYSAHKSGSKSVALISQVQLAYFNLLLKSTQFTRMAIDCRPKFDGSRQKIFTKKDDDLVDSVYVQLSSIFC